MNEEKCLHCRFWINVWPEAVDPNSDDAEGTCRRFPAVHVGDSNADPDMCVQEASHWSQPVMFATDWCGEFQAKTVSAKPPAPRGD